MHCVWWNKLIPILVAPSPDNFRRAVNRINPLPTLLPQYSTGREHGDVDLHHSVSAPVRVKTRNVLCLPDFSMLLVVYI